MDRDRHDGRRQRKELGAEEHVVGVGIFFPKAGGDVKTYSYMAADLSKVEREPDDLDVDEMDEADERAAQQEEQTTVV